jgi:hypothetical protein
MTTFADTSYQFQRGLAIPAKRKGRAVITARPFEWIVRMENVPDEFVYCEKIAWITQSVNCSIWGDPAPL